MEKKEQLNFIKKAICKPKKVIVIPEILIKVFKEWPLAAVFKQLVFWEDKGSDPDGWVYKSSKELAEEFMLSIKQVDRIFRIYADMDVIEYKLKKVNGAPTRHYKINHSVIIALALQNGAKIPKTELEPAESLVSPHRGNGNPPQGEWKPPTGGNLLLSEGNNIQLQHTKDKTLVETASQPIPENTNIDFIFQYWRNRMGKDKRTRLTDERKKLIKKRLANYPIEDLKQAIDGCAQNPFNMGENEDEKIYDDITLIFRNDTKLEQYRDQCNQSGEKLNGTRKQVSKHDAPVDRCKAAIAQQQAERGFDGPVVGENVGGVGSPMGKVVRIDANRGVGGLPYRDDSGTF